MSEIKVTFVFLKYTLLLFFFVSGHLLSKSKNNKQYWQITILPILAFAIISGLRFGRDIDYNLYYSVYSINLNGIEYEYLFTLIVNFFNRLGIPYYGFILFCSTFLIVSFLYLLRNFKQAAFYILPLFLIVSGIENNIRWYLALSFVFIAVGLLINKRYFLAICLAVVSYLVHEGMILVVFIIAMFFLLTKKKILFSPKISVILFTLTLTLASVKYLQQLTSVLDYLQLGFLSERGTGYVDKMDVIAGGEMSTGIHERSMTNQIRIFIGYVFILYFGGKYFEENRFEFPLSKCLYNLTVVSIIIMPLFTLVEIFDRISSALMSFSIIVAGITFFVAYKQRNSNKLAYFLLLFGFMCLILPLIKAPLEATEIHRMMFIWDANGREYLPASLFLK
ncbi:EpsG family protein [Bacteroidales bacterium OttesenSCG-928-I21]|nr:EpsG family protein [Bacteroidales bacterium OttesenSCG-928-I21]